MGTAPAVLPGPAAGAGADGAALVVGATGWGSTVQAGPGGSAGLASVGRPAIDGAVTRDGPVGAAGLAGAGAAGVTLRVGAGFAAMGAGTLAVRAGVAGAGGFALGPAAPWLGAAGRAVAGTVTTTTRSPFWGMTVTACESPVAAGVVVGLAVPLEPGVGAGLPGEPLDCAGRAASDEPGLLAGEVVGDVEALGVPVATGCCPAEPDASARAAVDGGPTGMMGRLATGAVGTGMGAGASRPVGSLWPSTELSDPGVREGVSQAGVAAGPAEVAQPRADPGESPEWASEKRVGPKVGVFPARAVTVGTGGGATCRTGGSLWPTSTWPGGGSVGVCGDGAASPAATVRLVPRSGAALED